MGIIIWLSPFNKNKNMAISFQNPFANDANLVNYFKMDGDDNFTANNITYVDGKINQSANFNGTNSKISYTGSQLTNFTVSFWIKTIATTSGKYIFKQANSTDNGNLDVAFANGMKISFNCYNGITTEAISTIDVNDGVWHNIVFTRTGSTGYLYIDGNLNVTKTGLNTHTIGNYVNVIGCHNAGVNWLDGKIDEFMIFTRVLSSGEIQRLYESYLLLSKFGQFLPTPNTLNLYRFNGNSVNSIGNIASTDSNITYVPGRYGKCANFNGTSSRITYTGTQLTNFTISLWFKTVSTNGGYLISQSAVNSNAFDVTIHNNGEISAVLWQDPYVGNKELLSNLKSLNDGKWHNLVTTRNGSTVIIYIDGNFDAKRTDMFTFTVGNYYKTIGSHSSGVNWLNGLMDEIIIENRAWSDNEVRKYYTNYLGRFAIL